VLESEARGCVATSSGKFSLIRLVMHNVSLNLIQRYFSGLFPLCSFFIFYVSASPLSVWLHLSRRVDLIPSMCVTRVSGV
jgi:hypothetical protein